MGLFITENMLQSINVVQLIINSMQAHNKELIAVTLVRPPFI